jgi:hypothetical protein
MATTVTTRLDFRDTALWDSIRNDPDWAPDSGRIEAYLTANGIVFDKAGGDGVLAYADGSVMVFSQNDPSLVWPKFLNAPTSEEDNDAKKIRQLKAFIAKAAAGTLTTAERDRFLGAVATQLLTLFKDPDG